MVEKDYTPCLVAGVKRARLRFSPLPTIRYGTKILNLKMQEIGLLICTWKNKFADAEIDCLDLFALNVPTVFASKNFILFTKDFRTLLTSRSNSIIRSRLCRFLGIKKEGVNTFSLMAGTTLPGCLDLFALNVSTSFATEFSTLCKISPHSAHKSLELLVVKYMKHLLTPNIYKICNLIEKLGVVM